MEALSWSPDLFDSIKKLKETVTQNSCSLQKENIISLKVVEKKTQSLVKTDNVSLAGYWW